MVSRAIDSEVFLWFFFLVTLNPLFVSNEAFFLFFNGEFFFVFISEFDQWEAWWFQLSVLEAASRTCDQISQASSVCGESTNSSELSLQRRSWCRSRQSSVWCLGSLGSNASHLASVHRSLLSLVFLAWNIRMKSWILFMRGALTLSDVPSGGNREIKESKHLLRGMA